MKRGLLTYDYRGRSCTVFELYRRVQRRMRPRNRQARFKTASLGVRVNVETDPRQPARWVKVRLVFSAPVRAASADTWVVFLCTDPDMSEVKKILAAIDQSVESLLQHALQISPAQVAVQLKAEELGHL